MFRKEWHWFEDPHDVAGADLLNFFSYNDVDVPGFKKKSALTTMLDLAHSEEALWEGMRKKFIREQVGKGKRNGIAVRIGLPWREIAPLYVAFRKEKKLIIDDPRTLRYCLIVGAYYEERLVAAGAFVEDGTHMRAYALASARFGNDGRMREIVGQANRMLIWETIKHAKEHGYRLFDLGGIDPESEDPRERSLAEFKEGFGGERRTGYYYTKVNSRILRSYLALRRKFRI